MRLQVRQTVSIDGLAACTDVVHLLFSVLLGRALVAMGIETCERLPNLETFQIVFKMKTFQYLCRNECYCQKGCAVLCG